MFKLQFYSVLENKYVDISLHSRLATAIKAANKEMNNKYDNLSILINGVRFNKFGKQQ